MGLLDALLGSAGGHDGRPAAQETSPVVRAILMLLAAKAGGAGGIPSASRTHFPGDLSSGTTGGFGSGMTPGGPAGGLGGLIGGLLGGAGAGGLLGGLVQQFDRNGYGEHVNSWISTGPNRAIDPDDVDRALGAETVDELATRSGLSRRSLLEELSQELPDALDRFTPEGRLPDDDDPPSARRDAF